MRLLHISDIHVTALENAGRDEVFEAFLEDLKRVQGEGTIDLVLFSGDLAFSGKPEEYVRAHRDILNPVAELLGLDPTRIVIAPGNHDIDRDGFDAIVEAGLRSSLTSEVAVEELFATEGRLAGFLGRLDAFTAFRSDFYGEDLQSTAADLATIHAFNIDGISVGVSALNTAWRATGAPDDADEGHLLLGTPQVHAALKAVENCALRIAVMHHPLEWLEKFDADEVRVDLDRQFHLQLTGHLHVADPMQIASTRGISVYSRTGSLYSDARYLNAYSVIDIDIASDSAAILLRSYWPERREFDVATHIVDGGRLDLPLKLGLEPAPLPAIRPSYSLVRRSLVDVASETSVLADQVVNGQDHDQLSDILVPPRLFPMPYEEWLAATEPGKDRIARLNLIELVGTNQCVVIVGGRETGLTSALLWTLDQQYEIDTGRLPIHVRFAEVGPGKDPLDKAIRKSVNGLASLPPDEDLPPLLVAIDDVDPHQPKPFRRIIAHMIAHPDQKYLIGCLPDQAQATFNALNDAGIRTTRGYLAPFGRRELKSLVEKIVGTRDSALVDRVLDVLERVKMPRTPFLMAALVVVLIEAEEFAQGESTGETGVLNSYATLMLRTNAPSSRRGLDERNLEHILSCFAEELVTGGRREMARVDAEQFLLDYWKTKGWTHSPAKVLDSLVERRVLAGDDETIRFRHPALLFLFAAKRLRESATFRELIESDPAAHSVTFQHAASLDRSDSRLLTLADETLASVLSSIEGLDADLFDQVTFLDGWSSAPDLQAAAKALGLPPIPDEVVDEHIDDMYDVMEDTTREFDTTDDNRTETALDRLVLAVELLSNVLRASELVDDVELKTEMLRRAINGWSVLAVAIAMEESRTNSMRDFLVSIFQEIFPDGDEDRLESRANEITRVLLSHLVGFQALSTLGTVKLLVILRSLLDDESWVASTPHALFTNFVYFNLHGPARVEYLAALLKTHGSHPLVRQLIKHTALNAYHATEFRDPESTALENILVDCTLIEHPRNGADEVSRAQGMILANLRKSRQLSRGQEESESLPLESIPEALEE